MLWHFFASRLSIPGREKKRHARYGRVSHWHTKSCPDYKWPFLVVTNPLHIWPGGSCCCIISLCPIRGSHDKDIARVHHYHLHGVWMFQLHWVTNREHTHSNSNQLLAEDFTLQKCLLGSPYLVLVALVFCRFSDPDFIGFPCDSPEESFSPTWDHVSVTCLSQIC